MKVLLYNSASRGTGQYVRSLKLSTIITAQDPSSTCTILAGNGVVDKLIPCRTAVIRLPQIQKLTSGVLTLSNSTYEHDQVSQISVPDALAERRRLITEAIRSIEPDIFIVDSRPAGVSGELIEALEFAAACGTRRLLFYRDIVDSPELTITRWRDDRIYRELSAGVHRSEAVSLCDPVVPVLDRLAG